nr:uncharacterized protein LOC128701675 [Cherax quadricarinatus]
MFLLRCVFFFALVTSSWTSSLPFFNLGAKPHQNASTSSSEALITTSSMPPTSNTSSDSPSHTSNSSSLNGLAGESQDMLCINSLRNEAVIQASVVMSIVNSFKDDYVRAKLFTSWDDINSSFNSNLDQQFLKVCDASDCSEVLPTLVKIPHSSPSTLQEAREEVATMTGIMQQYQIALEQLFLDETLTHRPPSEKSFLEEVDKVYRLLEGVTRILLKGVEHCGVVPEFSTISNLSRKMYIRTRNIRKSMRGFVTLRQFLFGLQKLVKDFS